MKSYSLDYIQQKVERKLKKTVNKLLRKPKPTEAVGLSLDCAKDAYGTRPDVSIHSYYRKGKRPSMQPRCLPDEEGFSYRSFAFPTEPTHYEAVALDIVNPGFSFQHNHLLDDANRVIYEAKVPFAELPIQHEYLLDPPKIKGTVAYLSNTVPNHYGHWIQLQLPMLRAYWDLFGKDNIDYYYMGDCPIPGFLNEMCRLMDLDPKQIINYPCRADRSLIAMKYRDIDKVNDIRNGIDMDEHCYQFLKQTLAAAVQQPSDGSAVFADKIFVMRGNVTARRELNLPEIKAVLEPQGFVFVTMEGRSIREQARIFSQARVIAGVHGSALHNILFAKPGTQVLEIFPYDYPEVSNYSLAAHGHCNYYYMVGEPLGEDTSNLSFTERNQAHIRVNPEKLLRLYKTMMAQPVARSTKAISS